ncbi:LamG-like jellyroll fold domain-containing protein [Nonomuraea sp. LPB2021202275-12-8]|uniref:LamG-like jellyroll fold domain-containing protein n=1 Tax=Nonomuraea sp. LPB2021202275-12-8 TaxID=3120159 RepID=UPI00300DB7BB
MSSRKVPAVVAAILALGALIVPTPPAWAVPLPSPTDRMDAAVRVAAAVDTARPGAKGRVLPLETDGQGRALVYVSGTDVTAAREAVKAAGGVVSDASGDRVRAAVPPGKLEDLASRSDVVEVRRPERPVPLDTTSEGVARSGAQAWHSASPARLGAGVKVGILDVGFGRLAAAQQAGDLPADVTVNNGLCSPQGQSTHGTTVAEVVHDMAPEAKLYLACVTDSMSFDDAARWLKGQGVQIVNVSMGFPGTGRGSGMPDAIDPDATDPVWSPATVVAWLRGQGVVVVAAAGNEAEQHAYGAVSDANRNGWLNFPGGGENQGFTVRESGAPITIELRWDAWPRTNTDYDVYVMDQLGVPSDNPGRLPVAVANRPQQETPGGLHPVETVTIENTEAGTAYWIYVKVKNSAPTSTRFDLTIHGRAQGVAIKHPEGSIAEPASSPYAIAVGAITPAGAAAGGDVEGYSSRGPTIDGRVKPDVIGFTGVSTFTGGPANPETRQGTSIAAAHVTGAAALYKGVRPGLDPAELEALLLDSSTRPGRNNAFGSGVLNVGQIRDLAPPSGSAFTPLPTYRRLLDTRDPAGRHPAPLARGETLALGVPDLPADATAVMIDVTAVNPTGDTELEFFSDTPQGIPSLAADARRVTTALVSVTLHPQDKTVKVKNSSATTEVVIDVYGWYSSQSSASTYFPKTSPYRLLDTRTWGIAAPKLDPDEEQILQVRGVAGVPGTATAVLVDVKATDVTETANLELYAKTARGKVTLSARPGETLQTLTLVPLADDGTIRIRNGGSGQAHAVVDLVGWYATGGGARYVPLRYAQPLFDSRTGTNTAPGAFDTADTRAVQVKLQPRVPSNATAVMLEVAQSRRRLAAATSVALWCTECGWWGHTNVSSSSYERQGGDGDPVPVSPVQTVSNSAVVSLGADGTLNAQNAQGDGPGSVGVPGVHISAGLTGYFVGGQAHGSAPLPSPTGHWRFDDGTGTTAADSSGNGRPATIQGGASWIGGRSGGAIMLNGTSGHAATAGSVLRTDRSFTVSTWVFLNRRGDWFTALAQSGRQQSAFYLQYSRETDKWRFVAPSADTASPPAYVSAGAATQAATGEWTHLAGVYVSGARQLKLYVNGALAGQATGTTWNADGPFTIGAAKSGGQVNNRFPGGVDDVRTYDRALSDSEVRELHRIPPPGLYDHWKFDEGSGTVTRSSEGRKTNGTLKDGASWETAGLAGGAVRLNGTSAFVEMPSRAIASTDSFTVTAWVKPISNVNGGCRIVLSQDDATMSGYALKHCGPGTGSWQLGKVSPTNLAAGTAAHGPPATLNRWTHLAGVYDADARVLRLHVNGSVVATVDGVTLDNALGAFAVGRGRLTSGSAGFFAGAIDDVRVYGGALSDGEIRVLGTAPR